MAKIKLTPAGPKVSGQVGQFVYVDLYAETIVRKPPVRRAPFRDGELKMQGKMIDADIYAKTILVDPVIRVAYLKKAKKGTGAYHVAVSDYFKAPVIRSIDIDRQAGIISALVSDNFRVERVHVKVIDANGNLIEEGAAVMQADEESWVYVTTVAGADAMGNKVCVEARDLPGNVVVKERVI
jgi:hypothetical protein